jgi:hypothetical protein
LRFSLLLIILINTQIEKLNDADADARTFSAQALGKIKDSKTVESLIEKL